MTATDAPSPDTTVLVRPGTLEDLPAVLAIYTHYVLTTTVTFNTAVPKPLDWQEKLRANVFEGPYHFLVAEIDGHVLGYVETLPLRNKPAYAHSLEVSIYVAPTTGGRGIGGALYDRLLPELTVDGFHRAYAIIALPNESSVAFHERFGFRHVGTMQEVGNKFGRWIDVGYWEKAL